jgi:glyoxylase I family protein
MSEPVPIKRFSHLCVGASDMETSLAFYTGVLGMDVVFDVHLDGAGLDSVTGMTGAAGRMVGTLIGGTTIELLDLGDVPAAHEGPTVAIPICRSPSPTSTPSTSRSPGEAT